jgi:serine/threonine protein kinase
VGQQLGNYQLLQFLGQGGFAEVYLAGHRYLHTRAAVKVLHAVLVQDEVESFLREAQMVARLRHYNIVRVLDFGVQDTIPYLVMDYAVHGTLRQRHVKGIQVPLPVVVGYTKQIAGALQYAHDQRLIHRDVKPENMLVGESQEILLSDFGIALAVQSTSSQRPQNIAGSIAYMAPEQIQAHPRPASDQYALAITVYEWLTGNRPFEGTYTEVAIKHTMVPPPPLRQFLPQVSPRIEHVLMKALAKDPYQRFPTVWAFAQALEQASSTATYQHVAPPVYSLPPVPPAPVEPIRTTPSNSAFVTQEAAYSASQPLANSLPLSQETPVSLSSSSFSSPAPPQPLGNSYPVPQQAAWVQTPQPLPYPERRKERRVSRRAMLAGIVGIAAASSGITWYASHRFPSVPIVFPKPNVDPTVQNILVPSTDALITYRGHTDLLWGVDWSPDGTLIASASKDGTAQVWTAKDGTHLFSYPQHPASPSQNDWAYSVAWANDSQRVATGFTRSPATIWNAKTGQSSGTYAAPSPSPTYSIAWSPDNNYIAAGRFDNTVIIFEVSTGRTVFTYTDHQDVVKTVRWSHDGQRIASGSQDGIIKVWRPSDGHLYLNYLGHQNVNIGTGEVYALAWSHDDKYIASCGNGFAVVWDSASGQELTKYMQQTGGIVNSIGWSHNDAYVATGGNDLSIHIWQPLTGQLVKKLPVGVVFGLAWSPDGTRIVTANYNKVAQIWSTK